MEKYPSGRRGSPAKGVGWVDRRPGSNPGFSANKTLGKSTFLGDFSAKKTALYPLLYPLQNMTEFYKLLHGIYEKRGH